jgi:flavorubredoxin
MHIGIVVHSQTRTIAELSRAAAEALRSHDHEVDIELLLTKGFGKPGSRDVSLHRVPDPSPYDLLIVAGPAVMRKASPVVLTWLDELDTLKGKRIVSLVSHALPPALTDKGRALTRIRSKLEALGGEIVLELAVQSMFAPSEEKKREAVRRVVELTQ